MKRFLILILALCSLLTAVPVGAVSAAAQTNGEVQTLDWAYQNYLSDDPVAPPELLSERRSSAAYLPEKEAKDYLRQQLKARTSVITVHMASSAYDPKCVTNMIESVLHTHTGVPTEGDYLLRHLQKWSGCGNLRASNGQFYYTITYTVYYHTAADQEAQVDAAVKELLKQLKLSEKTDYEKVKGIYDYIAANVRYDYANLYNPMYTLKHSAYAALINGKAVCQGYATLFYRLALELGVDCRYISGFSFDEAHGWNIVELDGKYYNLDVTWDEGRTDYQWFLKGSRNFTDHTRDSEFSSAAFHADYPTAAKDYSPPKNTVKITKQPVSVMVASGKTAKVKVYAKGDGLTYKWYYANPGSSKFTYTKSFKGNSYSLSMSTARAGRKVYCVITDKYGNSVKTKTVTLNMPATITKQPVSVVVASGKTAKVTVSAVGEGLTYKWYYANAGSSKFTYTKAFKGNSYTLSMNASRAGRKVYCVITDKQGNSVKTKTVTLGMSVKITKQPISVTVTSGKTAKVTVSAVGEGLTYKWYYANPGSSKFTYTKSFKGNFYSLAMNASRAGRRVYCVITDKYGNSVKTNVVTLKMK